MELGLELELDKKTQRCRPESVSVQQSFDSVFRDAQIKIIQTIFAVKSDKFSEMSGSQDREIFDQQDYWSCRKK